MLHYPEFSPEIISIGPFSIRWYGLMYLIGFVFAWLLGRYRLKKTTVMTIEQFETILSYGILGVILGARLGYVIFYDPIVYFNHPMDIIKVWQGGMSFHGGLIGVLIALFISARRFNIKYFTIVDFIAPLVPLGLFFGRIGNFINGELWGKITDSPMGMIFPTGGPFPRHPSQLYEATLEGLALFCIVWFFSAKKRPRMAVSGVFALFYGLFRTFLEFFRQPDAHIGYLAGSFLTMGMVLCLPLIAVGLFLLWLAYRKKDVKGNL